jgi:hypothetical protein
MIPVDQTTFGKGTGNCFAACVATILEKSLDSVPFFMDSGDEWYIQFVNWAYEQGLIAECVNSDYPGFEEDLAKMGYSIVTGKSPRGGGMYHSVVFKGSDMVHDPHPDRTGILTRSYAISFIPRVSDSVNEVNENGILPKNFFS